MPLQMANMRLEVARYASWYNGYRPHSFLRGATPGEVLRERPPANLRPRLEPRARYPVDAVTAAPQTRVQGKPGAVLELRVLRHEGAAHLPIVEVRRAA